MPTTYYQILKTRTLLMLETVKLQNQTLPCPEFLLIELCTCNFFRMLQAHSFKLALTFLFSCCVILTGSIISLGDCSLLEKLDLSCSQLLGNNIHIVIFVQLKINKLFLYSYIFIYKHTPRSY